MALPPRHLLRLVGVGAVAASLVAGLVASTPAAARSLKDQIASAHQQLRTLDNQAEAASEQYNAARIRLASAQQSATKANAALSSARTQLGTLQTSVTAFAAAAYRGGGNSAVLGLITDGSAGRYISQISTLQAVSAGEARTLASVAGAQRIEAQAQANARAALSRQRSATTAMAASRDKIVAAASKEQGILKGLEAREEAVVKAAKQRSARLAAEREAATLRAESQATQQGVNAISQPIRSIVEPIISGSGGASVAVQWAYAELGKPYQWAAGGPGSFDCSGLTQYVWGKAGVYLGHYTGDQWNEGEHVSRDELQPGDLVFFAYNDSEPSTIHHVGIYVGGGMMIDAPYTGVNVRKEPAFRSDYIGAVRP
ncbi:MAG TPA: NlpC/P60 family protein [Mycobacteriales bacterium]|nr:NlpC/P60 family protein [Mycobacteriales bacterium]